MSRNELINRCKQMIAEAYTDATEIIVAYLEFHPEEPREGLCREIDPDNYSALVSRVRRLQEKRRSEPVSDLPSADPTPNQKASIRSAKSAITRHPELAEELIRDREMRVVIEKAIDKARSGEHAKDERPDPTASRSAVQELALALTRHTAAVERNLRDVDSLSEADRPWLAKALENSIAANLEVAFLIENGMTRIDSDLADLLT